MVKATSTANANISYVAIVTVPQVSSVVINGGNPLSVKRGTTNFQVAHNVSFDASTTGLETGVTWAIKSTVKASSIHNNNGTLTVPRIETSRTIRIRATSKADTTKYAEVDVSIPLIVDASKTSLKEKFGVEEGGSDGVKRTFNLLSQYIKEGGVNGQSGTQTGMINLGDYIDLESLVVLAHISAGDGAISVNNDNITGTNEKLLRIIVVGVNTYTQNPINANTSHVVFQFKNIPGTYYRNNSNVVPDYATGPMRSYLTTKYLSGLTNAGVPVEVLWAPPRKVWNGNATLEPIQDLLWLPTSYEMGLTETWSGYNSKTGKTQLESSTNQVQLPYYNSNERRIKYGNYFQGDGGDKYYWTATVWNDRDDSWNYLGSIIYGTPDARVTDGSGKHPGELDWDMYYENNGVAPAFCVY
jgi:hypothetical protein